MSVLQPIASFTQREWQSILLGILLPGGIHCCPLGLPPPGVVIEWSISSWCLFCHCCSVTKSCPTLFDPHGLQLSRLSCPSLSPRVCSSSCPLSWWCYLAISLSVTLFSFGLQSFPASGSFPMRLLFVSGGLSTGASVLASVLPVNIQSWFPLGLTGLISLQSKGLSRVFSSTTIQKPQFFGP